MPAAGVLLGLFFAPEFAQAANVTWGNTGTNFNSGTSWSGGVRWDHVFFNVLGRGGVVSISGRAQLYGTLTARQRTVRLDDHSIVYGAVRARKILVTDASRIIPPSIVSP